MKRVALMAILGLAMLGLNGCGSPTNPSKTPYTQTVNGTVTVFGTNLHALTIPRDGNLSLILTWSDSSTDLDLYLAASTCQLLYPKASCNVLLSSRAATGARESVDRTVVNGETFSVFVDNLDFNKSSSYSIAVRID